MVIVFGLALACQGCFFQGDQGIVKNGTMQENKTLTVGEAFDGWSECESKTWSDFKSDNGQRIVQFECRVTGYPEFKKELRAILQNESKYDHFDLSSIVSTYQWKINKDDSFQLASITTNWKWEDGKSYEASGGSVSATFENEKTFDSAYLTSSDKLKNSLTARQYADMLWEFKYKAN